MKKLLLAVALLLSSVSIASAALTATFGDRNASGVYRMQADDSGVISFAVDTGVTYPYLVATTNQTLAAAQTGTTVMFTGAANSTKFTLPDCSASTLGYNYKFASTVAKTMQVTPAVGDTISYAALTAGQSLGNSSGAAGDGLELVCYAADSWAVKDINGTWTHTGFSP